MMSLLSLWRSRRHMAFWQRTMKRIVCLLVCLTLASPGPAARAQTPNAPAAAQAGEGSESHEKLPRFASLRFDDVNLRVGPGTNYPIDWVYKRRNLPVEIVFELGDWRQIRDQDNVTGWVKTLSLWKRRNVVVRGAELTLRAKPDDASDPVAVLKPGVIAHVRNCPGGNPWCEVEIDAYRGWLRRAQVYGVYADEAIDGQ